MTRTVLTAALFAAALSTPGLTAAPTIVGPVALRAGEAVEVDLYNSSNQTVMGGVDLLEAETGRVLDRVVFSVAGRRGATVGFNGSQAFVGAARGASGGPIVVGVFWNDNDAPPLTAGEPRRVDADQKTIVGGFKSISGMDSQMEVLEDQVESSPFRLAGPAMLRTAALAGDGMALVELVSIADGSVAASVAVQPGESVDFRLLNADEGSYVLRAMALSGGLYSAVSVESQGRVSSIGCQTMPDGNGAAIESLKLQHEGIELENLQAHEATHVQQRRGF